MSADQTIDYESLAQDAMRSVVRTVLQRVLKHGLPGDHHFYIAFNTGDPGVSISPRLKQKYPEEMTIVMQHRFWDLQVTDERFEIKLTFDNIPERLVVPYKAIKVFFDPSVPYGLQFEDPESSRDGRPDEIESIGQGVGPTIVGAATGHARENLTQLHPRGRDTQLAGSRSPKTGAGKLTQKRSSADEATAKARASDAKPATRKKNKPAEPRRLDTVASIDTGLDDTETPADTKSRRAAKKSSIGDTAIPVDADDSALRGDNDLPAPDDAPPRLVSEDPADDEFMADSETDLEKVARASSKNQADGMDDDDDTASGDFDKSANVVSLDAFRKK